MSVSIAVVGIVLEESTPAGCRPGTESVVGWVTSAMVVPLSYKPAYSKQVSVVCTPQPFCELLQSNHDHLPESNTKLVVIQKLRSYFFFL